MTGHETVSWRHPFVGMTPDTKKAWIAVAAIPFALVAAFLVGEGLATAFGYDLGGEELAPLWIAAAAGIPAMLIAVAPGLLAVRYGQRARHAGDPHGLAPALVGGTVGIAFVALNVLSYLVGTIGSTFFG